MGTQWQRERSRGLGLVLGTVFWFSCGLFSPASYSSDGQKSQLSEEGRHKGKKAQKLEFEQERDKEQAKRQEDKKKEDKPQEDEAGSAGGSGSSSYVVLGYNDLGMHCMNQDFERLCILPPFNNLHAQVIQRGKEPRMITGGVEVTYSIPSNTYSVGQTNFGEWEDKLFGVNLMLNVGLTGNGLQGTMTATGQNDWAATGIPITPINDQGRLDPYPLSVIKVASAGKTLATTHAVVPVSWEISCNLCQPNVPAGTPVTGAQVEFDILQQHDRKHKTTLENTAAKRPADLVRSLSRGACARHPGATRRQVIIACDAWFPCGPRRSADCHGKECLLCMSSWLSDQLSARYPFSKRHLLYGVPWRYERSRQPGADTVGFSTNVRQWPQKNAGLNLALKNPESSSRTRMDMEMFTALPLAVVRMRLDQRSRRRTICKQSNIKALLAQSQNVRCAIR